MRDRPDYYLSLLIIASNYDKTSAQNHVKGRQDAYPTVVFGDIYTEEADRVVFVSR